ncbi:MAG: protein kinase [Chlamydiota bacterium]
MSITVDQQLNDYSFTTTLSPISFDSCLQISPITVIESKENPLSLKEAKTLRQDCIKAYTLFEKALTEHSSLTNAWQLSSDIFERPSLQKAHALKTAYNHNQTYEALIDPIATTPTDQNRSFLALNIEELSERQKIEKKAEFFCLREYVLPSQIAMQNLHEFLRYPYSQNAELLPCKTRSIVLDILQKKQKDPFKEEQSELRFLGKGSFGEVYEISIGGQSYAVKALKEKPLSSSSEFSEASSSITSDESQNPTTLDSEYQNLLILNHPNIVKIMHADAKHLYMECIKGTTLKDGDFNLHQTLSILIQIADALIYMHSAGYVHYDIHGRNILIDKDGQAKLIDLGLMHPIDSQHTILNDIKSLLMSIPIFFRREPNYDPNNLLDTIKNMPTKDLTLDILKKILQETLASIE